MKKFLLVILSLSLFLSIGFIPEGSFSAETDDPDSLSVEGSLGSLQPPSDVTAASVVKVKNIITVSFKANGEYTEVYFENYGIDTVDSVSATYQLNRFDHQRQWVSVKTVTMSTTNLKPGKKFIKKFHNPQNYGYEQQVVSFTATDGKDVTEDSARNTRIKNPYSWRDITTLADHTHRHSSDFGLSYDEFKYSQKANSHYKNRKNKGYEYFLGSDNNIRVYQESTEYFGSYDSSGKTRTFFKPTKGREYWEDQKEKYK